MKDAYSFDVDEEGAAESYRKMYEAYCRIFRRMGLDFRAVEADTGAIGGTSSHEFMVIAESGEDAIVSCERCSYAANIEKAECPVPAVQPAAHSAAAAATPASRRVDTPGKRTIEEVSSFLGIAPAFLIKTLVFETDAGDVAILVSGRYEINEVKVRNYLGAEWIRLAPEERVRELTGAPSGFAGPVGLAMRVVADHSVRAIRDGATGANAKDAHLVHVVPGRDFSPEAYADIRLIAEDDRCPRCGGAIRFSRGIEVGHVFRLGTKYSRAMSVTYLDANGKERLVVMGCYGIGIGRTAAAAIEQSHDEDGIIWPVALAPFEVVIVPVIVKHEGIVREAERLGEALTARGIEVLLDDREDRPGIKFKDADLVGIPLRVTFGEKNFDAGFAEVRDRKTGTTDRVEISRLADRVASVVAAKKKEAEP
jgi:prolyl-tRNA synthetase